MNKRRLRQLNTLVLISVFCALVIMAVFTFGLAPKNQNSMDLNKLKGLDDSWIYRSMGGNEILIDLPTNIKTNSGEIVTISHQIPADAGEDTVLFFDTKFQSVLVSLNGRRIYEDGVLMGQKMTKNAVPRGHIVPLSAGKPGDIVTLQFASNYKGYGGYLGHIYYGSRGDVVSHMLRQHGVSFVVSFTVLIVAALLGISLFFMNNVSIDKKKAGYGFGFIFAAAVWSLLDNSMIQLVTKNIFAVYMCCNTLLLLIPMLYLMYLRCFALKRRYARIFEMAIYVFGINFLTGLTFQLVGVCDFASYLVFTKILITAGLVLLTGIMYLAADTYSDRSIYSNLWANIILCAGSLTEFVLGRFSFYKDYRGVALQIGLFLFAVLLLITIEKSVILEMSQERDEVISNIGKEKRQAVGTINASWIYSGLNAAIHSLKGHDKENSRLLYDTSVYMQRNMQAVNKTSMVPFSEELEYIRGYLGIAGRVHPQLEIVIEDKVTDFEVPYNSIEPLVENALTNGALAAEGRGKLVFRSYERLDCYAIQIVDNGKGAGPAKKFTGVVSYREIKKRLKDACGAVIEIKNKPDKGTIVTVKIPKSGFVIKE